MTCSRVIDKTHRLFADSPENCTLAFLGSVDTLLSFAAIAVVEPTKQTRAKSITNVRLIRLILVP